ncbi:MAG: DUF2752 domain-containing protein [Ignavibacteriales bacterium]|nr:DUF2752 domain-containing protein [Ignavibacteriales bacterium]MCF8316101.1 DUF2752 domain-containing protein [Ignavibacteriales bacterium]MCF8436603.1 DUF2752 domain-containing protein [Ignavibacteriales bacterium]
MNESIIKINDTAMDSAPVWKRIVGRLFREYAELVIWVAGLFYLFLINPSDSGHLVVCPLALSGIEWCPGCGLGRSVSHIFHGNLYDSLTTHPLGILALIIIGFRIFQLVKKVLIYKNQGV